MPNNLPPTSIEVPGREAATIPKVTPTAIAIAML